MIRCLQLAGHGRGTVAPNPMVGCVIVHNDRIIGEGYHRKHGEAHAEVNAIHSVTDQSLLEKSTLYVNLEPCSHHGKTPPCSELIIKKRIPKVVIAHEDPFPHVSGRGIKMLREAGVKVKTDILSEECKDLNRRFLTYTQKKRPYIILKWAQSNDRFIDYSRNFGDGKEPVHFSNFYTQAAVHKMRAEEAAVMVGTNTVLLDNPNLNVRFWSGNNPLRVTIDKHQRIPSGVNLKNDSVSTLIFIPKSSEINENLYFGIDFEQPVLTQIMDILYHRKIQSLIVEGGTGLLESFIDENLWDEAQVETAKFSLGSGVKAPCITEKILDVRKCENSIISTYKNVFIA